MGSKLLLLLALVAAGILAFVVVTSMSDDQVDSGQGRAVRPDEEEEAIVAPPPLADDPEQVAAVGNPATLVVLVTDEEERPIPGARITTNIDKMPAAKKSAVTGADGRAVIEGLPGGKKVSVQARGELTRIPGTKVVALSAGATAETRIVLKEGGAVTGTVLGPGGAPIGVPYRVEAIASRSRPGAPRIRRLNFPGRPVTGVKFKAEARVFSIGGLKPGTYVARASADGYIGAQSEPFEVVKGSIRDGVTVTLDRGGRVSGVVVRGRTGEPVANANVSLAPSSLISLSNVGLRIHRPGSRGIKTDEMGRFKILGVVPGDYTVTATAKELASGRVENVKVEKGRDAEGVMVQLGEGGAITGTVFGPDGRPVPNARVRISRVNTGVQIFGNFGGGIEADENGVFHEDHLEPGRYKVKLATGGVTASASVTIMMSGSVGGEQEKPKEKPLGPDEVMVYEGQVVKHDILSPGLCGIRGTITDDRGEPRSGRIRLEALEVEEDPAEAGNLRIDIPRFAKASDDGRFEFKALVPGRYALHASGAREEVSVIPGETAEVVIVVRPARVEGVVYAPSGKPAKGVAVHLRSLGQAGSGLRMSGFAFRGLVRTDDKGGYVLKDVTAGRYRVSAILGHERGESAEFEIGPDGIRKGIRIDLVTPTKIRVAVTDRDGNPVSGAMVVLRSVVSSAPGGRTNAEGIAILKTLPGTYDLMVIGKDGERIERKLTVGRAATQTLELTLE